MDGPYRTLPLSGRPPPGIVVPVGIRIVCEVELVGESLTGRASRGSAIREFTGWLGLLGALQDLAVVDPVATGEPGPVDSNEARA
jgi:hypothetical protein